MRKVWTGLLALVLVAALCAPLLVSAYADAMIYYVNTANKKSLNMRSSTDLGNNILTSIPNGAAVVVYEFLNSNTWAHIGYGGRDGYVMTRYLSLTPPSTQPSTAESLSFKDFKSTYYLASVKPSTPSGYVNMRWAPSKSTAVHDIYYSGSTLQVIAESKTWCQVYDTQKNICGFMMKEFLVPLSFGLEEVSQ